MRLLTAIGLLVALMTGCNAQSTKEFVAGAKAAVTGEVPAPVEVTIVAGSTVTAAAEGTMEQHVTELARIDACYEFGVGYDRRAVVEVAGVAYTVDDAFLLCGTHHRARVSQFKGARYLCAQRRYNDVDGRCLKIVGVGEGRK